MSQSAPVKMSTGIRLYTDCCQRYGVKQNEAIRAQLDRPDFLHLQVVDASHTFVGRLGAMAIISFVRHHRCIQELRLPQNGVDEACVELLCDLLVDEHPNLKAVDLSFNTLSTPSIRKLWNAVRQHSRVTQIKLEGCGVATEWTERLQSALKLNEEEEMKGFFPYGPPRSLLSWHTAFILVIGDESVVQEYCERCIPVVSSYMAAARVRVGAITINADDTQEMVLIKMKRCEDAFNFGLTWCVAFFGALPLHSSQRFALEKVLREKPPHPGPLHDKLGALRTPVYRTATSCFLYTHADYGVRTEASDFLSAALWLRAAGFASTAAYADLLSMGPPPAVVMTPGNYDARCQSDLYAALWTVFSEAPEGTSTAESQKSEIAPEFGHNGFNTTADEMDMIAKSAALGSYHSKKSALVLRYIQTEIMGGNVPFILYGSGGIGKAYILCYAATVLWERKRAGEVRVMDQVVCHCVDVYYASVVVFLYRLLRLFAPERETEVFTSAHQLAKAVRKGIETHAGSSTALLVGRLDLLDTCGYDESILSEWLPHSLPAHLRIVVSLNTESPVLPLLRRRTPQPQECLCPPISELNTVALFKQFLSLRGITLPGMEHHVVKLRESLYITENLYLQKEEAMTMLYPVLASSYLRHLLCTERSVHSEVDTIELLERHLPPTVKEILTCFLEKASLLNSFATIRTVLLLVCIAPLPATELGYICEELGTCKRHSTMPTLLQLTDMGLVTWYRDATAHILHPYAKDLIFEMFHEEVGALKVLMESHIYRLLTTNSAEVPGAFRHIIALMIENGSIKSAASLVENPLVMDTLLRQNEVNWLYATDAFLRLLHARELLLEVSTLGGPAVPAEMEESALICCLRDVIRHPSDLYQTSLLRKSFSPYSMLSNAKRAVTTRYLTVTPMNDGAENCSTATWSCEEGSYFFVNSRGDYVVVATRDTVTVLLSDLSKSVAQLNMPFERHQLITGALLATGTRVVITAQEQLLVWDFEGHSFFLFADTTAMTHTSSLNPFGSLLVASHLVPTSAEKQLCIIDVPKKRVVRELPIMEEGVLQEAWYCGNHVLLVSRCNIFLLDEEMKDQVCLPHDGLVNLASCNGDGRIIVANVYNFLYVWSSLGDLLHRLDIGSSPLIHLRMDSLGVNFVSHQGSGIRVWKTTTAACLFELSNPVQSESEIDYLTFTEDRSKIIGRAGRHFIVWETDRGRVMGAESVPQGLLRHLCVSGDHVYAASSTGDVLHWCLSDRLSSIEEVKNGRITSNWMLNAKVSSAAIRSVSTNQNGTLLVCVDQRNQVHLFSMTTGTPIQHSMGPVRCAAAFGSSAVAFIPLQELVLSVCVLHDSCVELCFLPSDAMADAIFSLFVSRDEKYIGATQILNNRSRTFLYCVEEEQRSMFQLSSHAGATLLVGFFGSFAYTVGEGDGCIRLWSLVRKVERVSYTHPKKMIAAVSNESGVLFCVDEAGDVYQVHVDNIVSPTQATFVVRNVGLTTVSSSLRKHGVQHMCICRYYLFVVSATSGEVFVVDTQHNNAWNRIAYQDVTVVLSCTEKDVPLLLTGHRSGKVFQHYINLP